MGHPVKASYFYYFKSTKMEIHQKNNKWVMPTCDENTICKAIIKKIVHRCSGLDPQTLLENQPVHFILNFQSPTKIYQSIPQ